MPFAHCDADSGQPAFAERMVQQASDLCEHENHLTRVIAGLNLPLIDIDDLYKRTPSHGYDLTPMLRLFLYKYAGDYSDSELADRVDSWQYLRIRFDLNGTPTQQTLSYTCATASMQTSAS